MEIFSRGRVPREKTSQLANMDFVRFSTDKMCAAASRSFLVGKVFAVIDGLSPSGGVNGVFVETRRTGASSQIPWVR